MRKNVLIREVEDTAYRRAKAAASLRGISMGAAVSEALDSWAESERNYSTEEEYRKNLDFVKKEWKKLRKHKGKWVVISSQELKGVFRSYEEASEYSSKFKLALTFVVEESPGEREIEFGPEMEIQR